MEEINKNLLTQEQFIALFPNTRFRYIHDVNKAIEQGTNILDMSWNKNGYGVFYTVNGFPPSGKADQSRLLSLNANYVDFDVDASLSQEEKDRLIKETLMSGLEAGAPAPTIINRTQKGAHFIWLYPETLKTPTPENIAKWRDVQKRLVRCFRGDANSIDPSRVLRLPYSLHLKDPNNPFEIKVVSYKPESRCTLEELNIAVPKYSSSEINDAQTSAMELLIKGVPIGEGLRHKASMQIAGLLLRGANTPEDIAVARMNYYNWDKKTVGSPERFEERKKELDNIFDGILKREVASKETEEVPKNKAKLWTAGEILAHDFGEQAWVVEYMIPKEGVMALSGNPGDFKTWAIIHIALNVARGGMVFKQFNAFRGNVLIVDEENHIRILKFRLGVLGAQSTDNIYFLSQAGVKVDNENSLENVLKIIKEKDIKLVIFDSLIRIHQQEENASGGMAKVDNSFKKITKEGASILFTHHHRKQQGFGSNNPGQSMRGSSDILAAVDCHITLEKKRDEEDRLILKQTKLRPDEVLKPFEVKILKESFVNGKACPSGFEYVGEHDEMKKKVEEVAEAVALVVRDEMKSREEIIELLSEDYGKTIVDFAIKLAKETERIERVPTEELPKENRRKAHYRLPVTPPNTPTEVENDIPASLPHIEVGKQEDDRTSLKEVEKDTDDKNTAS